MNRLREQLLLLLTSTATTNNEIMLDIGLKRNISLIIAKAILGLYLLPSYQDLSKSSMKDSNNTDNDGLIYSFRNGLEFGNKVQTIGMGSWINNS